MTKLPRGTGDEAATLALLTGPEAADVLAAVLGTAGRRARRPRGPPHRAPPGRRRHGRLPRPGPCRRPPDGEVAEEYLLVSSSRGRDVLDDAPRPRPAARAPTGACSRGGTPTTPHSRRCARAATPPSSRRSSPAPARSPTLELVGYRPLRRAVVRAERDGRTSWVKVLRPRAGRGGAPDVLDRHSRLLAAGLPVPRVTASTPDGLVVLDHLPGRPLVEAIGEDDAAGLDVADLVALLDRLPARRARPPAPRPVVRAGRRLRRGHRRLRRPCRAHRRGRARAARWAAPSSSGRDTSTSVPSSRRTATSTRAS